MYQSISETLNCVPSNLFLWGNPFDCDGIDVIVCVTGNPGIIDFYIEFATELYKGTGLPVCVIGQAGHDEICNHTVIKNQEHLFNLEGQIQHKLDLINNYIDKKSKLHFIGHSIGSWMLIELLYKHPYLNERVLSLNLLFPTIQKMAVSPNGKYFTKFIKRIQYFLICLFTVLHILPEPIKSFLASLYLKFQALPDTYNKRVLKFVNPKVLEKTLVLACDEMNTVTDLHIEAIENVKSFTNIIYSNTDGWAPVSYMDDLKQFQPPLQMTMVNINHAFVLKSSEHVAEMVVDNIKTKIYRCEK